MNRSAAPQRLWAAHAELDGLVRKERARRTHDGGPRVYAGRRDRPGCWQAIYVPGPPAKGATTDARDTQTRRASLSAAFQGIEGRDARTADPRKRITRPHAR